MFANVFLHGMLKQRKSPIHNTLHAACMLLTPSCNLSTDGRRSVPAAEHGQQKKSNLQARPMRFLHWHEKACLVLHRQAIRGLMADALPMHDRGSPSMQRRPTATGNSMRTVPPCAVAGAAASITTGADEAEALAAALVAGQAGVVEDNHALAAVADDAFEAGGAGSRWGACAGGPGGDDPKLHIFQLFLFWCAFVLRCPSVTSLSHSSHIQVA